MKTTNLENIRKHGENLNAIFNTGLEPIALCKKLRKLELTAHHATTCLCNTNTLEFLNHTRPWDLKQATEEEIDLFFDKIKASLKKVLGNKADIVFINFDPRGYALKIKDDYIKENNIKIYQDFGGYGIIAPDLTNN